MQQDVMISRMGSPGAEGVLVRNSSQLGMWIFLTTVTMLFAALTSAYAVRSAGPDWQRTPLPTVLWLNTAVLALSSFTLEKGRWNINSPDRARPWLISSALLGTIFLSGQLLAWHQLREAGIFIPSNPHSAFFYLLTAVHAVHLLAGLILLSHLAWRVGRGNLAGGPAGVLAATLWHFLGALWLFIFVLLTLW